MRRYLCSKNIGDSLSYYIATKLEKVSYAVLERAINQAKRNAIIEDIPLSSALIDELLDGVSLDDVIKTCQTTMYHKEKSL